MDLLWSYRNDGEIMSTLRFGQRVKCLMNNPVINEITEDDVNDLSDQIRQLKVLIKSQNHLFESFKCKFVLFNELSYNCRMNSSEQSLTDIRDWTSIMQG